MLMCNEIKIEKMCDECQWEYFDYQETLWEQSLFSPRDEELLELFPQSKTILTKKIMEWKKIKEEKEREIKELLKTLYTNTTDETTIFFVEKMIEILHMPEIAKAEKHIWRIGRLLPTKAKNNSQSDFKDGLQKARGRPIEEVARHYLELLPSSGKFKALCPFHNERTPSLFIYPETNTYHCFGCQEHGDNIKLVMELQKVDFKEAVVILS